MEEKPSQFRLYNVRTTARCLGNQARALIIEVLQVESLKSRQVIFDKSKTDTKHGEKSKKHNNVLVQGFISIEALCFQIRTSFAEF